MAPTCTPANFESIFFAPNALANGTETSAILPKSRRVNSIVFLSVYTHKKHKSWNLKRRIGRCFGYFLHALRRPAARRSSTRTSRITPVHARSKRLHGVSPGKYSRGSFPSDNIACHDPPRFPAHCLRLRFRRTEPTVGLRLCRQGEDHRS